jgi:predicted exporter
VGRGGAGNDGLVNDTRDRAVLYQQSGRYPAIHAYLKDHYAVVAQSDRLLAVDTRRTPTGRHAATGFPCFA